METRMNWCRDLEAEAILKNHGLKHRVMTVKVAGIDMADTHVQQTQDTQNSHLRSSHDE